MNTPTNSGLIASARPVRGLGKLICIALVAVAFLGACSDDKTPPDDPKDGKASKAEAKQSCQASAIAFGSCASQVLLAYPLSDTERANLSTCDFQSAVADSSPLDVFEGARQAVIANCF